MKHSPIGASSCNRWWNCPGSVALIATLPKQETSYAAAEGTAAHEVAEAYLDHIKTGSKRRDIYSEVGTTIMADDYEIEITEEMIDAVKVYTDAIHKETTYRGTGYQFLTVEERFNLEIEKEAFGTNDAFLYKPFHDLHLWDYKHGKGVVVEVENNKQLMYYALGALQGRDVAMVHTYIVQPRAYHADGPVRKCSYTLKQLKDFEFDLKCAIERTKQPDAPLKSGDHCKFCPAIANCDAVRAEVMQTAKNDFAAVSCNTDQLIEAVKLAPRIKDFLKEAERVLTERAVKGEETKGFKLVKARSNRVWKNDTSVINKFRETLGDAMFGKLKLISPSQMEKLAKDVIKKDDFLPYIEKPDKGLTLVPDADSRKAVKSGALEDFKDI